MDYRTAIYRYCNYRERCHQEVRNKLYELKATTPEVEELIAELIEKDLLNEERFAISYARGKFRILHWGRNKIKYQLKALRISDYCIRKALSMLDPEEYYQTLVKLTQSRIDHYRQIKPDWKKRVKVKTYLTGRGFEASLIEEVFKEHL